MLPNHAPLQVAETFKMLESLYPGRINLGLGRAPGTDQATALALRGSVRALQADDFPQKLEELVALGEGTRWPLTVEGVLDALRGGTLVPAADLTDDGTTLELPSRLLMTPFRPDGGPIALDHSTTAARGPDGGRRRGHAQLGGGNRDVGDDARQDRVTIVTQHHRRHTRRRDSRGQRVDRASDRAARHHRRGATGQRGRRGRSGGDHRSAEAGAYIFLP